ncbi:CHR23, partial [Symbiodinium pilosum]
DNIAEFAENVGIDEDELQQIFRKLGAGMWAALGQEVLREHDVIVALDDDAAAAVNEELVRQGLPTGCMLLSDFEWQLLRRKETFLQTDCADGSGERFQTVDALQAMERHAFEFGESRGSVADLEVPPWPRKPVGLGKDDGRVSDWRRLHAALLHGSWGIVWFLFLSWQANYCNPLCKIFDHADAISSEAQSQEEEEDISRTPEQL